MEQREAAKRAEAVRQEAESDVKQVSRNRQQRLEHRMNRIQAEDQQTEAGAEVKRSEGIRAEPRASSAGTSVPRSASKAFETTIARQANNWMIRGTVADYNRERPQPLTLQRKPQSLTAQAEAKSNSNSLAISAKRFIHRTQRMQAEQSHASDHSHKARPNESVRTHSQSSKEAALEPSTFSLKSPVDIASRRILSHQPPGDKAPGKILFSNVAVHDGAPSIQRKAAANGLPKATVSGWFKTSELDNRNRSTNPLSLILRRFEERLLMQSAEPGMLQFKWQTNTGLNRSTEQNNQQLPVAAKRLAQDADASSRSLKAIVHRKAKNAAASGIENEQFNSHSGPTAKAADSFSDTTTRMMKVNNNSADVQREVQITQEASEQRIVQGRLLARIASGNPKLLRSYARLTHKQQENVQKQLPTNNDFSIIGELPSRRSLSPLNNRNQSASSSDVVRATLIAKRKLQLDDIEKSQQKSVPSIRSTYAGLIQRSVSHQASFVQNDAAQTTAPRTAHTPEQLTLRAVPETAGDEPREGIRTDQITSSQVKMARATLVSRSRANSSFSVKLIQRFIRGNTGLPGMPHAARQRVSSSAASSKVAPAAAVKASAALRTFPALSVHEKGQIDPSIKKNEGSETLLYRAVERNREDSPHASKAEIAARIHRQAKPAVFSSKGMQTGNKMLQTLQKRSLSASTASAVGARSQSALRGLTTLVQAGEEIRNSSSTGESILSSEQARLSYAAVGSNRNGFGALGTSAGMTISRERGSMPALAHHKPAQAIQQEPPRQVKVEAPRELDPEKLQKMIMKIPQLRPEAIADQVYKALERKMKLEQRRRGY